MCWVKVNKNFFSGATSIQPNEITISTNACVLQHFSVLNIILLYVVRILSILNKTRNACVLQHFSVLNIILLYVVRILSILNKMRHTFIWD